MMGILLILLGWAFYLTGVIDKSIFYLEKAVSIMPNDATLNDHLGRCLLEVREKARSKLPVEKSFNY